MNELQELSIELYRGKSRQLFGQVPLLPIIKTSLEKILGRTLLLDSLFLLIINVPEDPSDLESPQVENLVPEFGYIYVRVYQNKFLIYRHPHPLEDVVTQTLRSELMQQYPEETYWGFRLDVPGMPPIGTARSKPSYLTPPVEGKIALNPDPNFEKPAFSLRKIAEAEPPLQSLRDFGLDADTPANLASSPLTIASNYTPAPLKIVLSTSLGQELTEKLPLSRQVEEGGFLVGRVYRDRDAPEQYLLEITNILSAQHTGASFLHLTFTGDSFLEVKRTLRQSTKGERLLGWYHTHLFAATSELGLSSIDLNLHFNTFTFPWQLAGLINLTPEQRILRFYARQANTMLLCPFYLTPHERD
jgi:hypothetical protein